MLRIIIPLVLSFYTSCQDTKQGQGVSVTQTPVLVDSKATPATNALFQNLFRMKGKGIIFGHQDDLAYGVGWKDEEFRSDVNDASGSFPGVFGWDISKLGTPNNIDGVSFERMREWIKKVYLKGGINTISWHVDNPFTGGNAWDVAPAVKHILPGGDKHEFFKQQLDLVASFFLSLKNDKGELIPVVFRPWHENNGGWFWWGSKSCTPEEYKALYAFTVHYLRDVKSVHNVIYAYSPDRFKNADEYLERYPGDNCIDVMGHDNYGNFNDSTLVKDGVKSLSTLVKLADEHRKLAALTETGMERIPVTIWWTSYLLNPIKNDPLARNISWFLVWRNGRPDHYYAPYPGQASVPDFLNFKNDPYTLFLENLKDLYTLHY